MGISEMYRHELIGCPAQFIRPGLASISGPRDDARLPDDCTVVRIDEGDAP